MKRSFKPKRETLLYAQFWGKNGKPVMLSPGRMKNNTTFFGRQSQATYSYVSTMQSSHSRNLILMQNYFHYTVHIEISTLAPTMSFMAIFIVLGSNQGLCNAFNSLASTVCFNHIHCPVFVCLQDIDIPNQLFC